MKSGFVTLVGRPNVGKSTLLNSIIGKKVAITSNKPQTTRNNIKGIYNDSESQIVFVDTPGIHKPNHKLGEFLNKQAYYSINDVDVILFLVDASESLGTGDKFVIEKFKDLKKPVILIINKIDKLTKEEVVNKILEYKDLYDFSEIIPLSALKKSNIKELIPSIKKYLKDDICYYDTNDYTNQSVEFLIAERIREKVFNLTEEEVPHSITVVIESIEISKESYKINAAIIVDRLSIKKIIVGHQGSKIKEIGTKARYDIEELLGKRVYLELFVKVIPKWRDKERYLKEFGFNEFE